MPTSRQRVFVLLRHVETIGDNDPVTFTETTLEAVLSDEFAARARVASCNGMGGYITMHEAEVDSPLVPQ